MGVSKSKLITYEAAKQRCSETELKRLYESFSRQARNSLLSEYNFINNVLGSSFPEQLARWVYIWIGGTPQGISFENLITGLVLLTEGSADEYTKFIYMLFAEDHRTPVDKRRFQKRLHELGLGSPSAYTAANDLFASGNSITFSHFDHFIKSRPEAFDLSAWLLREHLPARREERPANGPGRPPSTSTPNGSSGGSCAPHRFRLALTDRDSTSYKPTFHETLEEITQFELSQIYSLERHYRWLKTQCTSGAFTTQSMATLITPPFQSDVALGITSAFDVGADGEVDLKEFVCGLSTCCRGKPVEQLKFVFAAFDSGRSKRLLLADLERAARAFLRAQSVFSPSTPNDLELGSSALANEVWERFEASSTGYLSLGDFLLWANEPNISDSFLALLRLVCHIIFGVPPASTATEKTLIMDWYTICLQPPLHVGDNWFIISKQWWDAWDRYVSYKAEEKPVSNNVGELPSARNSVTKTNGDPSQAAQPLSSSLSSLGSSQSAASTVSMRSTPEHSAGVGGEAAATASAAARLSTLPHSNSSIRAAAPCTRYASERRANGGATPSSRKSSASRSSSRKKSSSPPAQVELLARANSAEPNAVAPAPQLPPAKPGEIDNSDLIVPPAKNVSCLSTDGLMLKPGLQAGFSYVPVPESLWRALERLYGAKQTLPRYVVDKEKEDGPALELYPLHLYIVRHVKVPGSGASAPSSRPSIPFAGLGATAAGGFFGFESASGQQTRPEPERIKREVVARVLFSQHHNIRFVRQFLCKQLRVNSDEVRLWQLYLKTDGSFDENHKRFFFDHDDATLKQCNLKQDDHLLFEVRNIDATWPEELLDENTARFYEVSSPGCTGLINLGNTCYFNSAFQCLSHTEPLRVYFQSGAHVYEINRKNKNGTSGFLSCSLADLLKEVWSGRYRCISPAKLRQEFMRHHRYFENNLQHDAQELLNVFLDMLHEDLNRADKSKYEALPDANGRPDEIVAQEAWKSHLRGNWSIIVDLFHGQMRSLLRCRSCCHSNSRFDPYCMISLPLPASLSGVIYDVFVFSANIASAPGSTPRRFSVWVEADRDSGHERRITFAQLKQALSRVASHSDYTIDPKRLFFTVVCASALSQFKYFPNDLDIVEQVNGFLLFAYELDFAVDQSSLQLPRVTTSQPASISTPQSSENVHTSSSVFGDMQRLSLESGGLAGLPIPAPDPSVSSEVADSRMEMTPIRAPASSLPQSRNQVIICYNRHMVRNDLYMLSIQHNEPRTFGQPFLLAIDPARSTCREVHARVREHCARFMTSLMRIGPPAASEGGGPPSGSSLYNSSSNLASESSSSSGVSFKSSSCAEGAASPQTSPSSAITAIAQSTTSPCWPFIIRRVSATGLWCSRCPWFRFCRGCPLDYSNELFSLVCPPPAASPAPQGQTRPEKPLPSATYLVLDWDASVLHMSNYEATISSMPYSDDSSVTECLDRMRRAINLSDCFESFFAEQKLDDDATCEQCRLKGQLSQKLDIWRVPPILVIHLKRFQAYNNRWIKSNTPVRFPYVDFDPESLKPVEPSTDADLSSPNSASSIVTSSGAKYKLFAITCHYGNVSGGHYIAYCRQNDAWFLYDDSSCKEIRVDQIEWSSAYLLFYEREGLDIKNFLDKIEYLRSPPSEQRTPVGPTRGSSSASQNAGATPALGVAPPPPPLSASQRPISANVREQLRHVQAVAEKTAVRPPPAGVAAPGKSIHESTTCTLM